MGFFDFFSKTKTPKELIIEKFYSDYPEIPYISDLREIGWIDQAEMFPKQCIIPKSMMQRYADGLLPGHIYMLYWLNKYESKKVPEYFEYKYGINFVQEKIFLTMNGYFNNGKPTEKGIAAMKEHYEVIEERHPTTKKQGSPVAPTPSLKLSGRSISNNLQDGNFLVPSTDKNLIATEFENLNTLISFAAKLSGLKKRFKIDSSKFSYGPNSTYYECHPTTATGRLSKYPLILHYDYGERMSHNPTHNYFGEVMYLQDGDIGKARLIFWHYGNGYIIHLGMLDQKLSVKKVEQCIDSRWIPLYKV